MTLHAASQDVTVKQRRKDGTQEEVNCLPCLPDYQACMRGVDCSDQLMSYYNIGRRSTKWWKRIFAYLIEVACLNALRFEDSWTNRSAKSPSYLHFRLELLHRLISGYHGRSRRGRPSLSVYEPRLDQSLQHLPTYGSSLECVVRNKVHEKRGLTRKEYRHETHMMCSVCGVHLCITKDRDCFRKFHTQSIYWTWPLVHSKQSIDFPFPYNIAFFIAQTHDKEVRMNSIYMYLLFFLSHMHKQTYRSGTIQ